MTNSRLGLPRAFLPDEPEPEDVLPDFDDEPWEAFVPDDDQEPVPEPGDFWIETDEKS